MFTLTLYDDAKPPRAIESIQTGPALLRVGRHPASDWVIEDPEHFISRHHLELRVSNTALFLRAIGRNDIFSGNPPQKIAKGVEVEIRSGEYIFVGPFQILVQDSFDAAVPSAGPREPLTNENLPAEYTLFDAFCEGAQIDPSQLMAEDPKQILREAGAVYRESVLGLSKMLRQRSKVRAEILADRTIIGGAENNLIKWAPSHRVLVDLLTNKQVGFVAGANAVENSFNDLDSHIESLLAGHRSALKTLLECLSPSQLESRAPRGILRDHVTQSWASFSDTHKNLERYLSEEGQNGLGDGFATGYEACARKKRA